VDCSTGDGVEVRCQTVMMLFRTTMQKDSSIRGPSVWQKSSHPRARFA
jgi:hypothetical protein